LIGIYPYSPGAAAESNQNERDDSHFEKTISRNGIDRPFVGFHRGPFLALLNPKQRKRLALSRPQFAGGLSEKINFGFLCDFDGRYGDV